MLETALLVVGGQGLQKRLQIRRKHNDLGRLGAKEHDLADNATRLRKQVNDQAVSIL